MNTENPSRVTGDIKTERPATSFRILQVFKADTVHKKLSVADYMGAPTAIHVL
jgi:hypothetical protein